MKIFRNLWTLGFVFTFALGFLANSFIVGQGVSANQKALEEIHKTALVLQGCITPEGACHKSNQAQIDAGVQQLIDVLNALHPPK